MSVQKRIVAVFTLASVLVLLTLLAVTRDATHAQEDASPTPILDVPVATPIVPSASSEGSAVQGVILAQEAAFPAFRNDNIELVSPVGVGQINFELPVNWRPSGQSFASVNLEYFESLPTNTNIDGREVAPLSILDIYLDDVLIDTVTLESSDEGSQSLQIPLPTEILVEKPSRNFVLSFVLRAYDHCEINSEARVLIRSDMSYLRVEYQELLPQLDLSRFPYPIYNGSFAGQSPVVLLILPNNPTVDDIQAAALLTAGLGKKVFNDLVIQYRTPDTLTADELYNQDAIVVGELAQHELISTWSEQGLLPIQQEVDIEDILNSEEWANQGLIQLIQNPDNPNHSVLIVTGITPQGTLLAARSLTYPIPLLGIQGDSAIISNVPNLPSIPVGFYPDNMVTFSELGEPQIEMNGLGGAVTSIDVPVPFRMRLSPNSYLDLQYRFSSILEDVGTIMSMELNSEIPVATFYLQNGSSQSEPIQIQGGVQSTHISLPADDVIFGIDNTLSMVLETNTDWNCFPPDQEDTWFIIGGDSTFHMDLQPIPLDQLVPEVAWFPAPFTSLSDMSDVWISLPEAPTSEELDQVFRLISLLSFQTHDGAGFNFRVSIGDIPSNVDLSQYHFVIIGRPSTNPLLRAINRYLPQPFSADSDELEQITDEGQFLSGQADIGVLEMLSSVWSGNHWILVISGTSATGQDHAMSVIVNQTADRSQLEGDVVLVQDEQLVTQFGQDLEEFGELLSSINDLSTEAAVASSSTPTVSSAVTVTPGPSPTPTLTRTLGPTETPTPLFSLTPSPVTRTPVPTFVPLEPTELEPVKLEQPQWISIALIVVGAIVVISVLFGLFQMFRPRQRDN